MPSFHADMKDILANRGYYHFGLETLGLNRNTIFPHPDDMDLSNQIWGTEKQKRT